MAAPAELQIEHDLETRTPTTPLAVNELNSAAPIRTACNPISHANENCIDFSDDTAVLKLPYSLPI